MKTFYLAHNLESRHYNREWELYVEREYNISLFNPFYDVPRDEIEQIDKTNRERRYKFDMKTCQKIVRRDLRILSKCDGIVAILPEDVQAIGTLFEIAYAKQIKLPIYVISKRHMNHPWVKVYATKRFEHIDDFEKFIEERFGKRKQHEFLR